MESSDTARRQPFFRFSILVLLFGLSTVLLTWKPPTVPRTKIRVLSGSMAPFLRGPHLKFICESCSFSYDTDPVLVSSQTYSRCPNCGHMNETDGIAHQGDVVSLFEGDSVQPSRWDVIAFRRNPDRIQEGESDVAIKRVVGLPGETVAFEGGELYLNDELYQKDFGEFFTLSTLVHDSDFKPSNFDPADEQEYVEAPAGQYNKQGSNWTFQNSQWTCTPVSDDFDTWLQYHQQYVVNGLVFPAEISVGSYMLDFNPYNQHADRFPMYHVYDLLAHVIIETDGLQRLGLRVSDVVLDLQISDGKYAIKQYGGEDVSLQSVGPIDSGAVQLRLGRIDGKAWLQVGDRDPVSFDMPLIEALEDRDQDWVNLVPLSLAAGGGRVSLQRFLLYRDVYWLDAESRNELFKFPNALSNGEWFVVGDNLVQSVDSRHWRVPVTRKQLLSLVKRVNLE